ncbi:ABC transporter ATP-binding protein [Spirulina sp. 06S082]|uniref:ABC transporter ATP-binding protein n=1 Tax=Spirulina sp. 06S082 TaxID=3110248 RepID=UPI002B1ECD6F|nr:ABC transporter ATP-binding protein [Spirulina sp. 06S082]MEA5469153.1 ABC transporter ATP-binding protein [Spirulina sp. 06S082]
MLRIQNLSKSYHKNPVLQDLSFEIKTGEIYGLLGANGAGKTTTLNILCNLLQPDRGTIVLDGLPVSHATKHLIGVAPQENLLYKSLSCRENLHFFSCLYGLTGQQQRDRISASLAAVNLSDRTNSIVETLSGGMKRRLNLAIALVHQPKLLILDEPTTGLDIETRYDLWALIRQLQQQGMTVLLTTHLLDEAEQLCDRLAILRSGQLLAEGNISQLRRFVKAQEIVSIQTQDEDRAIARGKELGFPHRYYGGRLAFWLPKALELTEIIACFENISLDSISRQPVGLEHIYLEVTRDRVS